MARYRGNVVNRGNGLALSFGTRDKTENKLKRPELGSVKQQNSQHLNLQLYRYFQCKRHTTVRRVRKIAQNDHQLRHARPSAGMEHLASHCADFD
jgi:hypothetical protein